MAIDLVAPPWTEQEFARAVEALDPHDAADRAELVSFLDERHAVHRQRGAAAVGRMRGWTLLALAKAPLRGDEVMFVLEELQSGRTAYEIACAARALRGVASPTSAVAGLVLRAASNLRATDDHVDLTRYGVLADDGTDAPTAMDALMDTLAWLCTTVPGTAGVLASALRSGDPPLSRGTLSGARPAGAAAGPAACLLHRRCPLERPAPLARGSVHQHRHHHLRRPGRQPSALRRLLSGWTHGGGLLLHALQQCRQM